MEIFYSPYTLVPLKRLNRSCTLEPKDGVYLMAVQGEHISFADYFPYSSSGDKGCEYFLQEFKHQKDEYEQKILYFLQRDKTFQSITPKKIFNHQSWTGSEDLVGNVIEYKLSRHDDRVFLDPLKRGLKLRLDANGLFERSSFNDFLLSIPPELLSSIDFIIDPLVEVDWKKLGIKTASDLIKGSPAEVKIHHPNSEFLKHRTKDTVFSSYLGSDLGKWHAYCEAIELADLEQIHGIMTQGYYQEETHFFKGSYKDGFTADLPMVRSLYQSLSKRNWVSFCQI